MKPTGIDNVGNTCYLNSALQVLFFSPQLTNVIMFFKDRFHSDNECVTRAYVDIVGDLYSEITPQVANLMSSFLKEYKYFQNMRMQHDSQETVMCILDSLSETVKKEYDFISVIFDSKFENVIQCRNCNHKVSSNETARNICIKSSAECVQEGIDETFAEEKMDDYKCDLCAEKACYRKRLGHKPSYIVMVVINMYDNYGQKVKTTMNIDEQIRVNNRMYNLYACICHHGRADNGHYTASVKSENVWYVIDDETVHVAKDKLHLRNAYTLFYKM